MIAHVGGVPLEETLPTLAGAGTGLLVVRAWLMVRVRRQRESGIGAAVAESRDLRGKGNRERAAGW